MSYEISFNLLLIAVGIFLLLRSGFYVINSLVNIARFLRLSEFTVSFILMASATSLPEFGIGLNSALSGNPLISLGNILGANILVLSFVLGFMILINGNLALKKHSPAHSSWLNFFMAISPVILFFDETLSRFDGFLLMGIFAFNLMRLMKFRATFARHHHFWSGFIERFKNHPAKLNFGFFLKNLTFFCLAVGVLLFSAFLTVKGIKNISSVFSISQIVIGLFVLALSTTLPELSFGIRAVLSRREEMSLGNLLGTSVFNSTLILGMVSFISPIKIQADISFLTSVVAMVLVVFLANLFLKTRDSLNRFEGAILIFVYLVFAAVQLIIL